MRCKASNSKPESKSNMKTKPTNRIASMLKHAALTVSTMQQPSTPALFITNPNAGELAKLRAENAALRAAIPAALPPRQIGEFRKSTRTSAEREANVSKVLKTERDSSGVIRHNSLRRLITWRTPAKGWFQKPTENIWSI